MKKNIIKKESGYTRTPKFGVTPKGGGYTIIETMIAVSLFLVVVTIGMGALLNANLLHNKSQSMRSIIDNLSFIMEDMSRNLRTGVNYYCILDVIPSNTDNTQSCPSGGGGISFKPVSGGSQWVYYISYNPNDSSKYSIFKSVDGLIVQLTPDEVVIDATKSSFTVLGALKGSADNLQPFVTIKLVGKIKLQNNTETPFSLQTSVSQRVLDR